MIQMQSLDRIVRADAMRGSHLAEASTVFRLFSGVTPVKVGFADKVVVSSGWEDAIGRHGLYW